MKLLNYLIPLILLPLFAFTSMHKFYVSVTQINFVEKEQSVQITSRLFIDDVENILRERHGDSITLAENQEPKTYNTLIERYLKENILVKINGKKVNLTYIGRAYEGDIMQCYLEIEDIKNIQFIEISNKMLFDAIEDQQNIVKTDINTKHKSVIHTSKHYNTILKF